MLKLCFGAAAAVLAALAAGCVELPAPETGREAGARKRYAVAISPAPVLNTQQFSFVFGGSCGTRVKVDSGGLVRELEFMALPGTVFQIEGVYCDNGNSILKVSTDEYPVSGVELYMDSRFAALYEARPPGRLRAARSREAILENLYAMEGCPYLWGGNFCPGIDGILEFYGPEGLSGGALSLWRLEGVDCSGLLYQASDGAVPRNTSWMTGFGEPVKIAGMTAPRIASVLEPLDIIVWDGHVIVVAGDDTVIESRPGTGVSRSPLEARLEEIMVRRAPADAIDSARGSVFVARRWHGGR